MLKNVVSFYESIKGKKVCFIGIGISQTPLIEIFAKSGAIVFAADRRQREKISVADKLEDLGVSLIFGDNYLDNLTEFDIIFRTPGLNFYTSELQLALEKGSVVTSEMELFFDLCPATIFGVTGSDGKTTTTTLIAKILEKSGKKVHLGGNIGRPLMPIINEIEPEDFVVAELSSFQLMSMRKSPQISVITNLAPNHLDVHKDMDEYIEAKKNIFAHQTAFSKTILNYDNDITASFNNLPRGEVLLFSSKKPVQNGAFLNSDGFLCYSKNGEITTIIHSSQIKMIGNHNIENLLAAIAAVFDYVTPQDILEVGSTFGGVAHRIELVLEKDGVKWYNDSIASSPSRTIAGLCSFDKKVILIAGGYDKKIPFDPLAPFILQKVKTLILIGATAKKIENAITSYKDFELSDIKIINAENMENAVRIAKEIAVNGDVVTLSPACASFDMYDNFEKRGEHFKSLVNLAN